MKEVIRDYKTITAQNALFRKLLEDASNSIGDEMAACGDDEVKDHPMLAKHKRVMDKIDKALSRTLVPVLTPNAVKQILNENP